MTSGPARRVGERDAMTAADRAHRRRARRAIYGPPVAAVIGLALVAGGASGLVLYERSSRHAADARTSVERHRLRPLDAVQRPLDEGAAPLAPRAAAQL